MTRLAGKVALVTGSASGIGRAQATRFVQEGARVVLADVDPEVLAIARGLGDDATGVVLDVSSETDWREAVTGVLARWGRIDVLVNTAGLSIPGSFDDLTPDALRRMFEVNQFGPFLGMKAVVPTMRAQGGGSIINVSSGAGLRGYGALVGYSSTKWGLRGLTRSTARGLAPDGIRVNGIHPGPIDTPMLMLNPPELNEQLRTQNPMGRLGTVEEVAAATVFLASDEASYVSGVDLAVDGSSAA